jgi:uncharacterized RDD family membrane protein YckC
LISAATDSLDTLRRVPAPEGIELTLRLAGPVPRAYAFIVDLAIRLMIFLVISGALGLLGRAGQGLLLITVFLLEWAYPVVFEVWMRGATPGKKMLGLVVLNDNGTPITFGASVTRNLLRAVDFLPMAYAFGLISMLLSRDFKRLGDLAAGTIVVHREQPPKRNPLPEIAAAAPKVMLTLDEKRAVLDFAERCPTLTEERADEIAAHAGALLGSQREPARQVLAIASHTAGA